MGWRDAARKLLLRVSLADDDVTALAKTFGVSEQAMTIRLTKLGFLASGIDLDLKKRLSIRIPIEETCCALIFEQSDRRPLQVQRLGFVGSTVSMPFATSSCVFPWFNQADS